MSTVLAREITKVQSPRQAIEMHDLRFAAGMCKDLIRRDIRTLSGKGAQQPFIADDPAMAKAEDGLECTMKVQPIMHSVRAQVT